MARTGPGMQMSNDDLLALARETLAIESRAIGEVSSRLNDEFAAACRLCMGTPGRIVVTGMGKSGHIATKIAATLASTGTPAFFMHPAEASHGDLGMITAQDLLLAISYSGETDEVVTILPLVKRMGANLISMTGKPSSTLARAADVHLDVAVSEEACPLNLAPTASTTATLAMGDALAVALLELRGFSSRDFAQVHPGGALGRQLYLRVRDLYPRNARPAVAPDENIRQTIVEMTSKRLGATVVEAEGRLLGIITDGDLRRMLEQTEDLSTLRAADIMSPAPKTIDKDELAVEALQILRNNSITQLVVTEEGQYVGIIHLHDLLREGIV